MTIQQPAARGRRALPPARELADACAGLVHEWHRGAPQLDWDATVAAFPARGDGWAAVAESLCLINCFQWHLEDDCRAAYDDAARLAALKREIDESNRRRVRCIDGIDVRLLDDLDGARTTEHAPVALVTPGNLLDRISILELKRYHATPRSVTAARVQEQLDDTCEGLDRLVDALAAGEQRLKVYGTVKLYGGRSS